MLREQTTIEFLSYLRTLDVRLTVKDDKLGCTAPKGVLTPELAAELKERKAELVALLSKNSGRQTPPVIRVGAREYTPPAGQRQLWFLDRLDPESSAYNISMAVRITGSVNRAALEQAIREIIRRHEVLRTAMIEVEGSPVAVVRDVNWNLQDLSLEHIEKSEREGAVRDALRADFRRHFDLTSPPLLRASLITLDADEYVLSVVMHHIAADGYSVGIFGDEVAALYKVFSEGQASPLPELAVQYGDYAHWRAQNYEGPALQSEIRYWKDKLREPLPVTEMPADRPRPAMRSTEGTRSLQILPTETLERVRRFSQSTNSTGFVTLLTAFYLLLFRYTRQEDLIVGSASSGRGRPEIEALIGLFINNLVLRINLEGDPTVTELIGRVREMVLSAFANENVPLERLVDAVQAHRDMNRAPLFQTMFVFQNRITGTAEFSNSVAAPIILDTETSRYDLTVEAAEWKNEMLLSWEYSTVLFDRSTIDRFQKHYHNLLESMIANPAQRVSALKILDQAERSEIVNLSVAGGEYPQGICVHQWIERQCSLTPNDLAVVFQGQTLTYRELDQRSNRLARHLRSLGIRPEALVGVLLERSIDLVVAMVAVLKAGGAYVPLDPSYPKDRLAFMLEDSGAAVLLTQESLLAGAPGTQATTICVDRLDLRTDEELAEPLECLARPDNRAYVIYTSGSTGKPKGVQVLHRSLVNFLASMQREPGLTSSDRLLAVTTPSFDIAGLEIYLPLVTGARVIIAPRSAVTDGAALARMLEDWRITVMQATPVTWRLLLETGWQGLPGLKILCGGEALGRELANRLLDCGAEVWNLYGPTETTIWSSLHRLQKGELAVPVGKPIANTRLYILDEHFEPVPRGAVGELYIGGDGVARGYLDRPELTAARFLDDPFCAGGRMYRTGDLARMLPGGLIECLGRVDQQVKLRGFRIELGEIESLLERHPSVRQAVVVVREDSPGDQRLVAYILGRDSRAADPEVLRDALQGNLPDYMLPSAYVFLDAFPLTPNRKVDRKALPAPDLTATVRSARYVPPSTNTEKQVASIWQALLKNPNVGVNENFFDLGGHSLLVVQLQTRLRRQFGWEPSLIDLFQHPTVGSIASLMDRQMPAQMNEKHLTAVSGD